MFIKQIIILSTTLASLGTMPAIATFDLVEDKVAEHVVQQNRTIEEVRQEIVNKFVDSKEEVALYDQIMPHVNSFYENEADLQIVLNAVAHAVDSSDQFAHQMKTFKVLWKEAKVSDPFILESALVDKREFLKGFDLPFDQQLILLAEVLTAVRESQLTIEEMRVVLEKIESIDGSEVLIHALKEEIGYKLQ